MRVVNFCTKLGGGAGGAAENFHNSLLINGHQSILINSKKNNFKKKIFNAGSFISKLLNYIVFKIYNYFKLYKKDYFFYSTPLEIGINLKKIKKIINFKPDAIVFHSVQNFLSTKDFEKIYKLYNTKIYWMIYDMGPFTGGCHYSWNCKKYINNCENCDASNYTYLKNLSSKNLYKKKNIYKKIDMTILPHSKYIMNQVCKSSLFNKKKIHLLNLGFDNKKFYKIDKKNIRKKYNISESKYIFLFTTPDLMTKRKGIQILKESLSKINLNLKKSIQIITLGNIDSSFSFGKDIEHLNFNFSNNFSFINEIYNLADVFLSPAIEDSGNSMLIQSLFAGLPFISFNIAYAYDLKNLDVGYVCKSISVDEFAFGIEYFILMNKKKYKDLSDNCIKIANDKYSNSILINNFLDIVNN